MRKLLLAAVVTAVAASGPARATSDRTLLYDGAGTGKVTFDGRLHAANGLRCDDCHPAPFATRKRALISADDHVAGAAGIVVSNHGGRVLDHTPGTAKLLPAIAKTVKGRILVFADGGVRYGADVLKLLALGAQAVLVGRPVLRGAVGGGAVGVAMVLNKLRDELVVAMVLTGTADVKRVGRKVLAPAAA